MLATQGLRFALQGVSPAAAAAAAAAGAATLVTTFRNLQEKHKGNLGLTEVSV